MDLKRIAVISLHTCPLSDEKSGEIGGMNIYILELCKQLAKKGIIVDIFTRQVEKESEKIVQVSKNLRIIHLKAGIIGKLEKKEVRKFIPEFSKNLISFMELENISYCLISCHYYLSGLVGMKIRKKHRIPMNITFHTLALMKNLVARNEEEREDLERIEAELTLTKKANKVIATSETDFEYINTLYNCPKSKIFILNPGVDNELFKPMEKKEAKKMVNFKSGGKLILFIGRIEALKGIDVLLYALKFLLVKDPKLNICLWIIGGNDTGQESKEYLRLKKIKKLLKITAFVKFIGQKEHNELPKYINAADIVIMPSQYESFGMSALESIACAVPVIATDVTGISSLLEKEQEYLVTSAGNPILLANKIKDLLTDDREYMRISREVFIRSREFVWEKVADKFIALMD